MLNVKAIRRTDGKRIETGFCPHCDEPIGFEPFCVNCGDVSGCESKYYRRGTVIKRTVGKYELFADRAKSLLDRWQRFKDKGNDADICIKGFMSEVLSGFEHDEPTNGLYNKYVVTKADGSPMDPDARYIVLRIDLTYEENDGSVRLLRRAALHAVRVFAKQINSVNTWLASDLLKLTDKIIDECTTKPEVTK